MATANRGPGPIFADVDVAVQVNEDLEWVRLMFRRSHKVLAASLPFPEALASHAAEVSAAAALKAKAAADEAAAALLLQEQKVTAAHGAETFDAAKSLKLADAADATMTSVEQTAAAPLLTPLRARGRAAPPLAPRRGDPTAIARCPATAALLGSSPSSRIAPGRRASPPSTFRAPRSPCITTWKETSWVTRSRNRCWPSIRLPPS